ncbi:CD209 antigen-like protein C [Xyrauchen texanus]|uniref:CD209 antigen-like protein C n=1 Tax=Xyrauchen texanus TaxID=154827 RepID=UPI0022426B1E|nr:CD209 antigen-like protein C [Xyrauchen texanus]
MIHEKGPFLVHFTILINFSILSTNTGLCVLLFSRVAGSIPTATTIVHNVSKLQSDSERNATDTERQLQNQRIKELLFSSPVTPRSCNTCEEGWTAYNGKCYSFSSEMQTWFESRDSCAASQAHLVIIESRTEQNFLFSRNLLNYWIGLNDLETEGHWIWVNNQTLNETGVEFWLRRNDNKNEPDNWSVDDASGENCACIANHVLNAWFDNSCTMKKNYICEKKYSFPCIDNYERN